MIVCFGAFDGYHRGHFRLFEKSREMARALGADWLPVTFEPHPRFVLGGLTARLFSRAEKSFLRRNFGVPEPYEIPFTRELAGTEPGEFLDGLRARFPVEGVVVGADFRFGRDRSGDGDFLRGYCARRGVALRLVPQLELGGLPVSSTRARECVERGEAEEAAALLGYPYFICSRVIRGQMRGRTLGYPTANIGVPPAKLLPGEGVYACAALRAGRWYPAAVSVGRNPTFMENAGVRVEAHLSGFGGDLYGRPLFLAFLSRLRDMERFSRPGDLIDRLGIDTARAEAIFAGRRDALGVFEMARAFVEAEF